MTGRPVDNCGVPWLDSGMGVGSKYKVVRRGDVWLVIDAHRGFGPKAHMIAEFDNGGDAWDFADKINADHQAAIASSYETRG